MAYLLDTNIVSHMIRDPKGIAAKRVATAGNDQIFTSVIVAAEIRFGAARKNSRQLDARVDGALDQMEILSFEEPADRYFALIRTKLEAAGTPIGNYDMLIAAHAMALGFTLVTANEREFARIEGLSVENWLC